MPLHLLHRLEDPVRRYYAGAAVPSSAAATPPPSTFLLRLLHRREELVRRCYASSAGVVASFACSTATRSPSAAASPLPQPPLLSPIA
ncbi:Os08g0505400 [Oryza sativa Japonica Group]|uniref:Os08g0505400 protein n=1 Tax=Oryza sativa subsp. japonica TaxID=39947 RepID=A0A0P0XHT2_ORYSJ|nr:Os08g0505400 [Oryza sativa Japonica Group]